MYALQRFLFAYLDKYCDVFRRKKKNEFFFLIYLIYFCKTSIVIDVSVVALKCELENQLLPKRPGFILHLQSTPLYSVKSNEYATY